MGFYNPYQQGPAVGQGMQDMISQIIQVMMMKKMMGGGKNQPPQQPMLPNGGQQPQTGLMGKTAGVGFDPMASQKEAEEKRKQEQMMQYIMMMMQGMR